MRAKFLARAALLPLLPLLAGGYVLLPDSGSGFYWEPGEVRIELRFGPSPALQDGTSWPASVQAALDEWNQQLTAVHLTGVVSSATTGGMNNGTNEAFFASDIYGQAFGPNVAAITVLTSDGLPERNTEADVIFNTAFRWDSYRGPLQIANDGPLDIRRIALHEFGHVLSLDHPDEDQPSAVPAIMNIAAGDLEHLAADDIAGVRFVYGPGVPPTLVAQPDLFAIPSLGTDLQITSTVAGTPPFTYEIYRDNQLVRTDHQSRGLPHDMAACQLAFDSAADFGTYRIDIVNRVGRVSTRNYSLLADPATTPPAILHAPRTLSLCPGRAAMLVVEASGVPAPSFRWFKDGSEILGQPGASLTLEGNTVATGSYTVWATNASGTAQSAPISVSLLPTAPSGGGWELVTPAVAAGYPMALAFGNDTFVAVGYQGGVLTSPDGLVWTRRTIGDGVSLTAIVFAADRFIAAGGADPSTRESVLFVSFDGVGWLRVPVALPPDTTFSGLAYGNGRFVALGRDGRTLSSSDGFTWQAGSLPRDPAEHCDALVFGAGQFMASTRPGRIWTSPDGLDWTPRVSGRPGGLSSLAYGNGIFVRAAAPTVNSALDQTVVSTSVNGIDWTHRIVQSTRSGGPQLVFFNGSFHLSDGSDHLVSTDGATWQQRNFCLRGARALGYGHGRYVALGVSGNNFSSRDGLNWIQTGRESEVAITGVSFVNHRFLVFGQPQSSDDGIAWSPMQDGGAEYGAAAYGNSAWVAVGPGIGHSADGVAWSATQVSGAVDFASVAFGAGRFVAVGNRTWTSGAAIAHSSNGRDWTDVVPPSGRRLRGIAHGPGGFIAVGAGGTILQSSDGLTWQARDAGTTRELHGVTWTGSSYIAVGGDGYGSITVREPDAPIPPNVTIVRSTDGVSWTATTRLDENILCAVCPVDGLVIAAGTNGTTLFSRDDGLSWSPGPHAPFDVWRLAAGRHTILGTGDRYPATLFRIDPAAFVANARLLAPPTVTPLGSEVVVSLESTASASAEVTWYRGNTQLAQSAGPVWKTSAESLVPGVYFAKFAGDATRVPLVLAPASASGDVTLVRADIRHPNGNLYDQFLLTGPSAQLRAGVGKVARISFRDLNEDIVQVEFSGSGALTIVLEDPTGPAKAPNYNQDVAYMKGHARIFVSDADETTNVSAFTVGRITAVDQSLFKSGVAYDGVADLALLAVHSRNGRFGGVRLGNAHLWDHADVTGLWAPDTTFLGPIVLGDISGYDTASAGLLVRSASSVTVAGGDLAQPNAQPVAVDGTPTLQFTAGTNSHGVELPLRQNTARFTKDGEDVTDRMAPSH